MPNITGSRADYRHSDYFFARHSTGKEALERSAPIEPMWKSIASGIGLVAFVATVIFITGWAP
jgi:hypothetical protein